MLFLPNIPITQYPVLCGGSGRRQEHFLLANQGVPVHNVRKETD
jgi:hypothetical protein